jgi:4-hydroxy-tetrahydrodipicolinate reductase
MKLLVVGYGRMGRLVEALAPEYGCDVAGVLDEHINRDGEALAPGSWPDVDVAIDFSTAEAVQVNFPRLAALGIHVVLGTTGLGDAVTRLERIAAEAGIGVVAAPNFSMGAVLFSELAHAAAQLMGPAEEYGAWIHELHHAAKRDAPSGTALALQARLRAAGYPRGVDVAASRAGHIPGTHTVGFDGPSDTITLTHTVRDRGTFARGALVAARWVAHRRGWFTMHDCLGLTGEHP